MKKRSSSSQGSEKSLQGTSSRKDKKFIKFDYTNNLQCFITSSEQLTEPLPLKPPHKDKPLKTNPTETVRPPTEDKQNSLAQLRVPRKNRGKITSNSQNAFNNKLLLLEYEGDDEFKPQCKPEIAGTTKDSPKSEEEDQVVTEIVNSCVRVITQDTEHSSNPISARFTPHGNSTPTNMSVPLGHPLMMQIVPEEYYYYMTKSQAVRNRRAISNEESKAYYIDLKNVELDGRTTIMVRNIPNKYTQDMLLELFQKNHKKKFDFFYLPIDYNNNCNVGYAFLNFIHTKFIVDFYRDFHQRKWNKFNSVKVCQVCYARIQGTAQLEHHFQHSNVLQQRDRRFRPLIGLKTLQENISSLVQKQKDQHTVQDNEQS